ncbi:UNVERIFIED_CONTAM: hypothetical protein HDU68_006914, partial [Siphonaria sp. JEL0065]
EQQTKFDILIEASELWQLEEFKERLEAVSGTAALNAVFTEEVALLKQRQDAEASKKAAAAAAAASGIAVIKKTKAPWSSKETTALIKGVKNFPGGTVSRWEKVAEYVNLHGVDTPADSNDRSADECIKKSKELQDASVAERNALQSAAADSAAKKKAVEIKEKATDRKEVNTDLAVPAVAGGAAKVAAKPVVAPAAATGTTAGGFILPDNDKWTSAEQAALEEGLKKYPAAQFSAAPAKRWDQIAADIGKSAKEVKQRMKDLQDAIKKKSGKK